MVEENLEGMSDGFDDFIKNFPKREKLRNQHSEAYSKIAKECENNGSHLEPDQNEKQCGHCYQDLVPPKSDVGIAYGIKIEEPNILFDERAINPLSSKEEIKASEDIKEVLDYTTGLERYIDQFDISKK